jgi:hypothetical protein
MTLTLNPIDVWMDLKVRGKKKNCDDKATKNKKK